MKRLSKLLIGLLTTVMVFGSMPMADAARSTTSAPNRYLLRDQQTSFHGTTTLGQATMTNPLSLTGAFSISFWAKNDDISGTHTVIGHSSTTGKIGYANSKWFIRTVDGGSSDNTLPMYVGSWHHYVLIKDSSNIVTFYIDGAANVLYSGAAQAGTLTLNSVMFSTGGGAFAGDIDDLCVWTRVLTISEINGLRISGVIPISSLSVAYLFNDAVNLIAADSSGNANALTIISGSFSTDVPLRPRLAIRNYNASITSNSGNVRTTSAGVDASTAAGITASTWFKYSVASGSADLEFFLNAGSKNSTRFNVETGTRKLFVFTNDSVGTGHTVIKPSNTLTENVWHNIVFTTKYDQITTTTASIYVDGILWGTGTVANDIQASDSFETIGSVAQGDKFSDILVYNRVLTLAEIQGIYFQGIVPDSPKIHWPLTEGAGSVANDTSGNSVNGTITTSFFTSDSPFKSRQAINPNLIKNGDFEYAPPFIAATSGNGRWVDGTAAGSLTNNIFGWSVPSTPTGTGHVQFDSSQSHSGVYSLKVSTEAVGSATQASTYLSNTQANQLISGIPCVPNTSYTLGYWMKTTINSGTAASGSNVVLREQGATGSTITTTPGTLVNTTTGWTQYSLVVTTNASTRFCALDLKNKGDDGTATLIMDAWFDDIVLTHTTPVTRVVP